MRIYSKKVVTMFVLITIALSNVNAQDLIDEDFLDHIETNAKPLWNENAASFSANTIPEKYKDESATIIGYRRMVNIDKKSRFGFLTRGERSLVFFEKVRFKIRLADKSSVGKFTAVYFRYSDKEDGFSANIIKPDGSIKAVSLNEAVGVESLSDVPEFFKSFFDQQVGNDRRYFKVAVPDLEPGDILDYVTITKSKLDVAGSGYIEFTPTYELCSKIYPVLFNQIIMETDDKSFFKSLSINGAPDFKKETATDPGFFRYVFTDADRGVEKDVNFINDYQVYPLTKFQVVYANNENKKGALIGEKGEIKSGFSKEELALKAWEDYVQVGDSRYSYYTTVRAVVNEVWGSLKKAGAKDWSEKQYINNVYYKLRNLVVNRDTYLSDKVLAYMFSELLNEKDIKSELIISVSKSIGRLKDVLFEDEIRYVSKVGDDLYFNCTDYSNPGELVESLLASEAYIIGPVEKKGGGQKITPYKLPDATMADNVVNYSINASLNNLNTLVVSRKSDYKGITKSRQIGEAMKFIPYMVDDYKNFGGDDPTEKMRGAQADEYYKSVKALKDRFKAAKPDYVKDHLQGEFLQKVKYTNFSLESDGRTTKTLPLVFTEEFELPGMVRKAGKKYLVNIPGLVGSQLQIKKDERIRKHDINVGFARSLKWEINFKIPDGYTAEGLKELNTTVDNEAGTYSCVAEEKAGTIQLKINKVYKKANLSKEKWADMLAFIDAAYASSFKYILLKPKG